MQNIYVIKNGKHLQGPYTLDDIKKNGLHVTDVVWYEGVPNNTYALEMNDLRYLIKEDRSTTDSKVLRRYYRRRRKKLFNALKGLLHL
jgi:hypothetical protein